MLAKAYRDQMQWRRITVRQNPRSRLLAHRSKCRSEDPEARAARRQLTGSCDIGRFGWRVCKGQVAIADKDIHISTREVQHEKYANPQLDRRGLCTAIERQQLPWPGIVLVSLDRV